MSSESQRSFSSLTLRLALSTWQSAFGRERGRFGSSGEDSFSLGDVTAAIARKAPFSARTLHNGQDTVLKLRQGFIRKDFLCNSHLPGCSPAPACMFCQSWKRQMLLPLTGTPGFLTAGSTAFLCRALQARPWLPEQPCAARVFGKRKDFLKRSELG